MKNYKLLIVCFFCTTILNAQNKDLYSYSNSLQFANYLYKSNEYKLAIDEYQRVLFLNPGNREATLKIFDSYIQSNQIIEGVKYANRLKQIVSYNDSINTIFGKLLILSHNFNEIDSGFINNIGLNEQRLYLQCGKAMCAYNWEKAVDLIPHLEEYDKLQTFVPIIKKTSSVKFKSPALSATLSAILPGSGKIYAGYWKDGLFTLLFTSVAIWQSYRGFDNNGITSTYGWIMGGVGISLYAGNLYGAVKAAHKKNHYHSHKIHDEFEKAFIDLYSNY